MKINKMEIWAWLKKQDYETEYMSYNGNSEFKMYYELDMPDILHFKFAITIVAHILSLIILFLQPSPERFT